MPAILLLATLLCSVLLLHPVFAAAAAPAGAELARLTDDGAWTWFNDPRAIVVGQRLYAGWITRRGDVQLLGRNLETGQQSIITLDAGFQGDDHDNPALIRNPDGTISAFYGPHNGDAIRHVLVTVAPDGSMKSGPPQEIPASEHDVTGTQGWTYANPFRLRDEGGRLYLFSRGRNYNPVFRTFDGTSWGPARNIILNAPQRPYVKYASDDRDTIGFAYTDAHPNAGPGNNIYYAALRAGAFWRADGRKIKDLSAGPLSVAESPRVFDRIADPKRTGDNAWIWDVALEPQSGHPVIVFATFPSVRAHQYHYARWTGDKWADQILVADAGGAITNSEQIEPHYSGGIALDPADPAILYLARQSPPGTWRLEQWKTPDGGATWRQVLIATGQAPADEQFRPSVPRYRPANTEMVLWLHGAYDHWDFSRGGGYRTGVNLWTCPATKPGGSGDNRK